MAITTAQGYVNQIEREGERISDPPALYVQTVRSLAEDGPNYLAHLLKAPRTMLEGSRVRSYFRLSSRLAFLRPLLRLEHCDDSTILMPRRAVPASPGGERRGEAPEADPGVRPDDADRAHDPTAGRVLLRPNTCRRERVSGSAWHSPR